MPKKSKKPYVPPVGRQLPPMPKGATLAEGWNYLADCCDVFRAYLPYAEVPETMGWSDPAEAMRKERWEKQEVEESNAAAVRAAYAVLLEKRQWPETPEAVCFLMEARFEWAAKTCRLLPSFQAPCDSIHQWPEPPLWKRTLEWLVFDLYDAEIRLPKKWWDGSSFEDYYG